MREINHPNFTINNPLKNHDTNIQQITNDATRTTTNETLDNSFNLLPILINLLSLFVTNILTLNTNKSR